MAGVSKIDRPAANRDAAVRAIRASAATGDASAIRRTLLEALVEHLDAVGGAIWTTGPGQQLQLLLQLGLGRDRIDVVHDRWPGHRELLTTTLAGTSAQFASAAFEPETAAGDGPRQFNLLLYPWQIPGRPAELVELFVPPESLQSHDVAIETVRTFCEAARSDASARQEQSPTASNEARAAFLDAVHRSLDLDRVAITAANDGRALLGCDRLSIATGRNRSLRMMAVSGLTSFDRRSPAIRSLEALGRVVQDDGTPCFHSGETDNVPDSQRESLAACIEQISPKILCVVPLDAVEDGTSVPVGVLIAEHFDDSLDAAALQDNCLQIAPSVGSAVANAARYESMTRIPIIGRLLRGRSRPFRRQGLSRRVLAIAIVAVLAALVVVPADLEISGRAELQPRNRRPVYASSTGVVDELMVDHAKPVEAGEPLIRLRNRELDFEVSRVEGELQTVLQQIADVQALRTRPVRSSTSPPTSADEMAAREQELKQVRDSLTAQLEILRRQQQDLTLTSPLSGQVLTWNVRELLDSRPVELGQRLLAVGDVDGPWVVEIRVRDRDIGHVRAAQAERKPNLDVEIVQPGDPPVRCHGTVRSVTETVEYDEVDGPTVLVTVDIDADQLESPKPGTTVAARIVCGRARLGYVLFRQMIDALRTWWAF